MHCFSVCYELMKIVVILLIRRSDFLIRYIDIWSFIATVIMIQWLRCWQQNYGGHFHFQWEKEQTTVHYILGLFIFSIVSCLVQYLGPSITTSYGSPNRKDSQIPLRLTEVESSNSVPFEFWSVDVSSGNVHFFPHQISNIVINRLKMSGSW